jgi:hypothetical protein
MVYDQESQNNQKVQLDLEEFEQDPLDEGTYFSVIEKDH